jgi:hypothetical protein
MYEEERGKACEAAIEMGRTYTPARGSSTSDGEVLLGAAIVAGTMLRMTVAKMARTEIRI